jgi:integrase/recombinase XerD
MVAKGNAPAYVEQAVARIEYIVDCLKAEVISDLTASATQQAVSRLSQNGKGLATCNAYLRSAKAFTSWLARDKRTQEDPLAALAAVNEATDRRRVRRELSGEEFEWLIISTEGRTLKEQSLSGPHRAMLYRLAAGTGFRAGELRSLRPGSFMLDAEPFTVRVSAAYSKRRRDDTQPIRADLAGLLQTFIAGLPKGRPVFEHMPVYTARMLRADLLAARTAWIDAAVDQKIRSEREQSDFLAFRDKSGEVVDFHAFRHFYISTVVNSGASIKVAQELARHSSPTLTIGRYSHARRSDLHGALNSLPASKRPAQPASAVEVQSVSSAKPSAQHLAQHSGSDSRQTVAESCDGMQTLGVATPGKKATHKTRLDAVLDAAVQDGAESCDERRARGSNPQPVTRHHISSVAASHSLTLRRLLPT